MASSQEWCLTSCDQENRMSKTVKQALCYKSIQGWQAGAGSGCRGFVLSTGKKMRKDEQLGSKRGLGFCFCLLLIVQQLRGGGGRDAWSVRLTLGTGMGTRACRALSWARGEYPWPAVPNPVTDECQACRARPWTCAFWQLHGTWESYSCTRGLCWVGARRAFLGQAPKLVPLIKPEFWSAL